MDNKEQLSLYDLINRSTPQDIEFVYNFISDQLIDKKQDDLIIRRTAKVSLDGTDEEIIKSISELLNISGYQIDIKQLKNQINNVKKQSQETIDIIENYKSFLELNNSPNSKIQELFDIGKFIKKFKSDLQLEIPININQIPDFIVYNKTLKIGIEHTRLIDGEIEKLIGKINKILSKTKNIVENNVATQKSLINISFKYSEKIYNNKSLTDKLSQKEILEISKLISQEIIKFYDSQTTTKLPSYIEKIAISQTKFPTEINLVENFLAKDNYISTLFDTIRKKELKIDNYRNEGQVDELWLLIVNSGIKSSSSFIIEKIIIEDSKFDKIFIMDNFDLNILQLK